MTFQTKAETARFSRPRLRRLCNLGLNPDVARPLRSGLDMSLGPRTGKTEKSDETSSRSDFRTKYRLQKHLKMLNFHLYSSIQQIGKFKPL